MRWQFCGPRRVTTLLGTRARLSPPISALRCADRSLEPNGTRPPESLRVTPATNSSRHLAPTSSPRHPTVLLKTTQQLSPMIWPSQRQANPRTPLMKLGRFDRSDPHPPRQRRAVRGTLHRPARHPRTEFRGMPSSGRRPEQSGQAVQTLSAARARCQLVDRLAIADASRPQRQRECSASALIAWPWQPAMRGDAHSEQRLTLTRRRDQWLWNRSRVIHDARPAFHLRPSRPFEPLEQDAVALVHAQPPNIIGKKLNDLEYAIKCLIGVTFDRLAQHPFRPSARIARAGVSRADAHREQA